MSELTFNLLRLGYLILLWLFVLSAVAVLRRDLSVRGRSASSQPVREVTPGPWISPVQPADASPEVPQVIGVPGLGPMVGSAPVIVGPGIPAPIVVGPGGANPVISVPGHGGAATGGTPVAMGGAGPTVPNPPATAPRYLAISTGALAGSRLPLSGQPITIGRAPGNTLVFEDDYASAHHARLYATPEGWVVEDLNSTNGTFVNGAPLSGAMLLPVGVPVTIGHSTFKLVV